MARNFSRKDIFYHGNGWYPSANASDLFVYLNTLSLDNPGLMDAAEALLKVNVGADEFKVTARFEAALTFLQQAYMSERIKEINYLKTKLPHLNFSSEINGLELIRLINEAILGKENFLLRVQQERQRSLLENKKGPGYYSYTQALGSYIEKALNQMTGQGQTETTKKDEKSLSMLVNRILIRNINANMSSLNLTQLATIVGITQTQLMPELAKLEKEGALKRKNSEELSIRAVESAIKNSGVFQKIYREEREHLKELEKISHHVLSKYGKLSNDNGELQKGMEKITRAENYLASLEGKTHLTKTEIAVKKILKNQKEKPNIRFDLNFKPNTGMGGEIQIYEDLANALIVGANGGKIDISNIEMGAVEFNYENTPKVIQEYYSEIMSSINADTQKNFLEIGNKFAGTYQNIENALRKDIKQLKDLEKVFILHHNVKDYASAIKGGFDGFEGGTYQGLDLIEAISALASVGFSAADINWLKTCVMNTTSYALGASNKKSLEEYLSIFASTLLFDDGITIAQQAANNTLSSLNVLHLFPVNGIYVPSSYVMELIYTKLNSEKTSKAKSSISTTIHPGSINFQSELDNLSSQRVFKRARWRAIGDKQISAMSIEIKFLGNFMDIINNL